MINDDEELFDFYDDSLDLDAEENIDESIGFQEQPVGSSDSGDVQKKRSSLGFLTVIVLALGGGGYAFYEFYLKDNAPANIPIVKLDAAFLKDKGSSESAAEDLSLVSDPVSTAINDGSEISVFAEDLYEGTAIQVENPDASETTPSVITPLPSLDQIKDVELANIEDINLPITPKADDAEEHISEIIDDVAQSVELKEEDILPKTETVLEDRSDIVEVDSAAVIQEEVFIDELTAIPPSLNDENVKDAPEKESEIRIITPKSKSVSVPETVSAKKAAPRPKAAEKPVAVRVEPDKNQWVIKAILPGKAVIHNSVSGETRSVEVGDSISFIGRINSIKKINNKWVVTGSNGKIYQ